MVPYRPHPSLQAGPGISLKLQAITLRVTVANAPQEQLLPWKLLTATKAVKERRRVEH